MASKLSPRQSWAPTESGSHDCLGLSLLAMNDYGSGLPECQRAAALSANDVTLAVALARARVLAGDRTGARNVLDQLHARARTSYVPQSLIAQVYVALGDEGQGLKWLERAYADHDGYLARLKVEPAFDSVRSDPNFKSLMRRLKFPS